MQSTDCNKTNPRIAPNTTFAFIGAGNMASAIIGGLIQAAVKPEQFTVIEPESAARAKLQAQFDIHAHDCAHPCLRQCELIVWAVKPQSFKEAAASVAAFTQEALHLSVAAGVTTHSLTQWLGTERIVRAMPNTPALIGQGISGLFALEGLPDSDRELVDAVMGVTGQTLWFDQESKLDAVTALSGSGPAYVFYFLEAMVQAALELGLTQTQAQRLACTTFAGSTALALASSEPLGTLRERVTSKGGTTYAALTHLENQHVKATFVAAIQAAAKRAQELGAQFG